MILLSTGNTTTRQRATSCNHINKQISEGRRSGTDREHFSQKILFIPTEKWILPVIAFLSFLWQCDPDADSAQVMERAHTRYLGRWDSPTNLLASWGHRAHTISQQSNYTALPQGSTPRKGNSFRHITSDLLEILPTYLSLSPTGTHVPQPCIVVFWTKLKAKWFQLILVWSKKNNFTWLQDKLQMFTITPSSTHSPTSCWKSEKPMPWVQPVLGHSTCGCQRQSTGQIQPCLLHHLRPWPWSFLWQRMYVVLRGCSLQCSGFSLCSQICYTKHSLKLPQVFIVVKTKHLLYENHQFPFSLPQPALTFLQTQGKWLLTCSHLHTLTRFSLEICMYTQWLPACCKCTTFLLSNM